MDYDNYEDLYLFSIEEMDKAIRHTRHELAGLNTGKASPGMVEGIHVEVLAYGGASMPIKEIAAVSTPDLRTIQIQPWDKSTVRDIEKAIQKSNIGLHPLVDGGIIRIPIPELTGERRQELVKVAHKRAEDGRIGVRHARQETMNALKKMQKEGIISEDNLHRYEKEIQEETDERIKLIAEVLNSKEQDLTTV